MVINTGSSRSMGIYGYIYACMLLAACTRTVTVRPIVDIPPFPVLPTCVEAHAQGQMSGDMVAFTREEIDGYAEALAKERTCRVEREALMEAWGRKIENRLRAVIAP